MIIPVIQLGNSTLRKKSLPIKDFQDKNIKNIITDLTDTLHDVQRKFKYGRGIAAPQIGVLKRIIFIDMPDFKSELINPKILKISKKKFEVWDSCFSFNVAFFVLVDRHYSIEVEYFDQEGKRHTIEAEDKLSELLQHEIDHLDGILAIDRMKDNKIMMKSEWEKLK
jgi:peptide deformylase